MLLATKVILEDERVSERYDKSSSIQVSERQMNLHKAGLMCNVETRSTHLKVFDQSQEQQYKTP